MNNSQNHTSDSITLMELFGLIKRHLVIIMIAGMIGGAVTFVACKLFVQPVYKASAKMIVNVRQDQSSTVTNDQITSSQKLADTYAIIIRSQTVLVPVIDKLQLPMTYEELQKIVSVTSVNNTQVMEVAVENTDRDLAIKIVNEILYISPAIILDAVEAGSVKMIEPAYSANRPVAPNTNLNTILASFLSMFLVVVIIVLQTVLDNTYKTELELTSDLGLPVLGIIPDYDASQRS